MDNHNLRGPNIKKRPKCKNCEGKGLLKKGDKVVKCQRCIGHPTRRPGKTARCWARS